MGSNIIYVLVMIGYNTVHHQVASTDEMSYHLNGSDCMSELNYQRTKRRAETYNRKYACLPFQDAEMYAILMQHTGSVFDGKRFKSNGRFTFSLGN